MVLKNYAYNIDIRKVEVFFVVVLFVVFFTLNIQIMKGFLSLSICAR